MMFLRMSVPTAIFGAVLFLLAGRLEVWGFWAYLGVMYFSASITYTVLGKVSPGYADYATRVPWRLIPHVF